MLAPCKFAIVNKRTSKTVKSDSSAIAWKKLYSIGSTATRSHKYTYQVIEVTHENQQFDITRHTDTRSQLRGDKGHGWSTHTNHHRRSSRPAACQKRGKLHIGDRGKTRRQRRQGGYRRYFRMDDNYSWRHYQSRSWKHERDIHVKQCATKHHYPIYRYHAAVPSHSQERKP